MSSESRPSDAAVKPTRSTNSTETRRRSAAAGSRAEAGACGAATPALLSLVPHSPQKFTPGALAVPHDGHGATRLAPHSAQNFRPSSFGVEHAAQITVPLASFGGTYPAANAGGAADESRARRSSRKRGLATPAAIPDTRREVRVHEPTITEQALRPGVVTTLVGVTFAAWLVVIVRDARHGRRPRDRSRLGRLVSRHLGDDDGGDDAAVGNADGALVFEGCGGLDRSARPRNGAVRGGIPDRLDWIRPRRVRAVPPRA